jgi:hypothetical protein
MCKCSKNQTPKESREILSKFKDAADAATVLGTGIFLIPAPEIGTLEYKTINVPNLTYFDCAKRAHNCFAFQWVANDHVSLAEIEKTQASCSGFCNYAGGYCPPGCICGPDNDYCNQSS